MRIKSAERLDWPKALARRFTVKRIDTPDYHGYATLLRVDRIGEPLYATFGEQKIRIVDNGYDLLQHFPDGEHYALLTAFDERGEPIQWYIDIVGRTGVDERGVPWYEDLYLDIVISLEGETLLLDVDELDEALRRGEVTRSQYDFAWREASALLDALEADLFPLLWLSEVHRALLAEEIEAR